MCVQHVQVYSITHKCVRSERDGGVKVVWQCGRMRKVIPFPYHSSSSSTVVATRTLFSLVYF